MAANYWTALTLQALSKPDRLVKNNLLHSWRVTAWYFFLFVSGSAFVFPSVFILITFTQCSTVTNLGDIFIGIYYVSAWYCRRCVMALQVFLFICAAYFCGKSLMFFFSICFACFFQPFHLSWHSYIMLVMNVRCTWLIKWSTQTWWSFAGNATLWIQHRAHASAKILKADKSQMIWAQKKPDISYLTLSVELNM